MTPTFCAYQLIKTFEKLETKAYKCPAGVWTIGYGHTKGVKAGDVITEEQADKLLTEDVNVFAKELTKALNADEIELQSRHQFDALICFAFNVGMNSLIHSTMWEKLKAKDYCGASIQFERWNKAKVNGKYVALKGLTRRRNAERQLFLEPDEEY